jgi:ATP-dependent DNA helicase DinG
VHAGKFGRKPPEPLPLPLRHLIGDDGLGPLVRDLYQAIDLARDEVKLTRPDEDDERNRIARWRLMSRAENTLDRLMALATDPEDKTIRWAESQAMTYRGDKRERVVLRSAPVSVAPFLRTAMFDQFPVIMASATLAPGGSFSYLREVLGLAEDEVISHDAGTPFDYPRQAVLYYPEKGLPEPTGSQVEAWRGYAQAATRHLVESSGGGALLLFTSRSAMNEAWQALAAGFRERGLLVLRQGDMPSPELVRLMKEDGNAVLFALRTFFEGIDIQGRALRLVVIDKLPFGVPTDLVRIAREEAIKRRHGKWAAWDRLTVPGMILILTQAFGRLIRHRDDLGVIAILDPRLSSKGYGKGIREALPPARPTTDIHEAARYLEGIR